LTVLIPARTRCAEECGFWNGFATVFQVPEIRESSVEPVVEPVVQQRADVARVGDIEVEPRQGGYLVTIRLNAPPPDAEWVKLFEHPPVLALVPPARRPTLSDAAIEIMVRNEEQMGASVRYAETAIAEANRLYNDEVLPRRARHQRTRDAARAPDDVGLDAMSRAANAL
jgi:hypothetical protein